MHLTYAEPPQVEAGGRKFVGRVLFGLLVLLAALVGASTGLFLVYSNDLPQVEQLEHYRPSSVTDLYDDHSRVIGLLSQTTRTTLRFFVTL